MDDGVAGDQRYYYDVMMMITLLMTSSTRNRESSEIVAKRGAISQLCCGQYSNSFQQLLNLYKYFLFIIHWSVGGEWHDPHHNHPRAKS